MISAIRKRLEEREEGFTLIELLVVVIIIGILAAIAIPVFLNQRVRGWEAAAQSDLRNAATSQESWLTGNPAGYGTLANIVTEGFSGSTGVNLVVDVNDADSYCMTANHNNGGDFFRLDSNVGDIVRAATAAGLPACT